MKKLLVAAALILAGTLGSCQGATPATVRPTPAPVQEVGLFTPLGSTTPISKRVTYVIDQLPSAWPVAAAVKFIDPYTGSQWRMARSCPTGAYRCITVKVGDLRAPVLASTFHYNSARVTILVDVSYAKHHERTWSAKKYLIAHELGHAGGINGHSNTCSNLMFRSDRCRQYGLTSEQKAVLRRM